MPTVKSLLSKLNLGTSVAEFDEDLEQYFVETNTFREFIKDNVDIIAGDKGTGKTAIYRFINKKQDEIEELADVDILPAFNPSGNPIFKSLTEETLLNEFSYKQLWKSYILALIGNHVLSNYDHLKGSNLDHLLNGLGLRSQNATPKGVFARIIEQLPNFFKWKSAEVAFTASPEGMPIITPKIEFSKDELKKIESQKFSVEDAFHVLDRALGDLGLRVWITFDRLDEAFQGFAEIEVAALRALLQTYLDMSEFRHFKMKLFLRRDLFRRVTASGFVNLTHINSKKLEIIWDEEDLLNLLCRRIRQNSEFVEQLGLEEASDSVMFDRLFPDQVDFGSRKPLTWVWIMRRIRDGNDVKPPRNLIDLVKFSQQAQLRKEDRDGRELGDGELIEADALRRGLKQLSENRVNDTLLAEAGIFASVISRFQDGKAEHNTASLSDVLGVSEREVRSEIKPLIEIGFLEDIKGTYKIPTLYREGLSITQGKAFATGGPATDDDE